MADEQTTPKPADRPERRRMGPLDTIADGAFAGMIGASGVALWFLGVDVLNHELLFTPSLVGGALLWGIEATPDHVVSMGMVAAFTAVHCSVFVLFGIVCAWIVDRFREPPDIPLLALLCFFALQGSFLAATQILVPSLVEILGHGVIATGNVFGAIGMAIALRAWELQARGVPAPVEAGTP